MGLTLDDLNDEVKKELSNLQKILANRTESEALLERTGDEAQRTLDMLQLIMFRLSKKSGLPPRCLIIRNIKRFGDRAFASGEFGDIWKGEVGDSESDRIECVVKVARWYCTLDGEEGYEKAVKTHLREAVLWGQLKHPNVLPFLGMYYLDESMKDICLVSPSMVNGNLGQFLKKSRVEQIYDITLGMEYLHSEDIVHGDLKEFNILVREDCRACICDFGLARLTMTYGFGATMSCWGGTAGPYMAPEVQKGELSSKKSHVYAFGTLCYRILHAVYDLPNLATVPQGQDPPPPQPENIPKDDGHIWLLLHECWQQQASARPTAAHIIMRILPKNVQVTAASHWDESLYTTMRNNIDFRPLCVSVSVSESHSPKIAAIRADVRPTNDTQVFSQPSSKHIPASDTEASLLHISLLSRIKSIASLGYNFVAPRLTSSRRDTHRLPISTGDYTNVSTVHGDQHCVYYSSRRDPRAGTVNATMKSPEYKTIGCGDIVCESELGFSFFQQSSWDGNSSAARKFCASRVTTQGGGESSTRLTTVFYYGEKRKEAWRIDYQRFRMDV
ncbi:hypothetical protein V5O48_010223, partial [Marasmius crinis-equi]